MRLRLLGDIIFTIPAIILLKNYYPDTTIYYVVEEKFREIGEMLPHVHRLICIPRQMTIKQHFSFRKEIKSLGIATVVDFHSGPKSALLTRLTGAATRIGYITPNRNYAYTRRIPRHFGSQPTHSVFNQCKLLEPLGIPIDHNPLPRYPRMDLSASVASPELIALLNQKAGQKKAIIHVGAGNQFRDWGIDNYSRLLDLLSRDQAAIFLVGHTPAETEKGLILQQQRPVHNLTGRLSLRELLYLISRADVYFGVDSGPLHLASLTQTPIVGVYGPNIPEISGPWRFENVTLLQLPLKCRPCSQKKCIYNEITCMKEIHADDAYQAIRHYL